MPRNRNCEKIRCRVRACPNIRGSEDYNKKHGITFHRFPKNPHSRDKWTAFCENPDIQEILETDRSHRLVVCSWHFLPTELIGDGRSRLAFNGLVPHLRPPPPVDGTLDTEIIYADGPAPPFVPRRKDHAVKIINADADPFPSLHKSIMPKGPLLLPANHMMPQGITLNSSPLMMFTRQQSVPISSANNVQGKKLILPMPQQLKILPSPNPIQAGMSKALVLKTKNTAQKVSPIKATIKPQPGTVTVSKKSSSPTVAGQDTTATSIVFCPDRKRLVKVQEMPTATAPKPAERQKISSPQPQLLLRPTTINLPGSNTPRKVMLIKQGSDKSARLILKVLGPNLTGAAPLNDIVAASAVHDAKKQIEPKLAGTAAIPKAASTGNLNKSTWNVENPVEVPTVETKIEMNPLEDMEMQIDQDQSTSSSSTLPKIVDVVSLKEAVRKDSPSDSAGLISKKRKSTDSPDSNSTEQSQPGKPLKLMIKDDFNYKKGPEIAGIKSYFPNISQYAFLQKFGNAVNHFLYVVSDEEKWGIATGTLITFQKAELLKLLNMPATPNILAKKGVPVKVVSQGPLFEQVRRLAQALFTKGTLLTIKNMEKAVKNQIIAIDNSNSGEHKISIEQLKAVKTVPKPPDSLSHFTLNLNDKGEVTVDKSLSATASSTTVSSPVKLEEVPKVKEEPKTKQPVLIAPSPAKMFPIMSPFSQLPGSLTPFPSNLLAPGTFVTKSQPMMMLQSGALVPSTVPLPAGNEALMEPTSTPPSSLRIPQYAIEELRKRLPLLVGKEGDFKVSKANFQQVLGELAKMGYKVDPKGKVLKMKAKVKIVLPKPLKPVTILDDTLMEDGKRLRGPNLKRRGDLMYQEITRLRRRNIYLKRQIDRLRNKPLTKQKRKEITLETLKEVFTKDQYAFFLSQYNNVRRGNCGQRYEAPIYEYCSSLFLESRRVYRRLRQTFVLPDERSLLVNVPNPQYFKLPKKKQWKKKTPEEAAAAKEAAAAAVAAQAISGEPQKKKRKPTIKKMSNESKSLAEIVKEATGEMPDHVVHVPAIPNPDFSGLVEHLLESLENSDGSQSPSTGPTVVTLTLP